MILEVNHNFDVIFIQELSWTTIRLIPSSDNCEGIPLVGIVNHPNWLTFAREPNMIIDCPRVIIFINIRLSSLHLSFYKDIINHRDILLMSFFNNGDIFWIMNIYLDSSHSAIKYLEDTEVDICNLLVITGDFNICDSIWDPSFCHHSSISNDLIIIADSFNLNLSCLINQVSTRYFNNDNDSNSVINLMFLWCNSSKLNNHSIHPEWCLTSNHVPLSITISIAKENINLCKKTITKNSNEKELFIKEVIASFTNLDTSNILDMPKLERVVNDFANIIDNA